MAKAIFPRSGMSEIGFGDRNSPLSKGEGVTIDWYKGWFYQADRMNWADLIHIDSRLIINCL